MTEGCYLPSPGTSPASSFLVNYGTSGYQFEIILLVVDHGAAGVKYCPANMLHSTTIILCGIMWHFFILLLFYVAFNSATFLHQMSYTIAPDIDQSLSANRFLFLGGPSTAE